jgi:hypothetical protein
VIFGQRDDGYELNIVQLCVLGLIPVFITYWLVRNKHILRGNKEIAKKFQQLYDNVKLPWKNTNHNAVLFYPLFLFRRLIFIWLPFIFQGLPCIQVLLTLIIFLAYTSWICHTKPIQSKKVQSILVLNESSLLLSGYVTLFFSTKPDIMHAFNVGFLQITQIGIVVMINLLHIVIDYHLEKKTEARLDQMLIKRKAKAEKKKFDLFEKKRAKFRLMMANAAYKPVVKKEPELNVKQQTRPVYRPAFNVMNVEVCTTKAPPKPARRAKMPSYHRWVHNGEPKIVVTEA